VSESGGTPEPGLSLRAQKSFERFVQAAKRHSGNVNRNGFVFGMVGADLSQTGLLVVIGDRLSGFSVTVDTLL